MEVKVRPLLMEDMAGVAFRYHTNRHYYLFSLEDGKKVRLLPGQIALDGVQHGAQPERSVDDVI